MKSSFKVVNKGDATVRKIARNKKAYNFITKHISPKVSLARVEAKDYKDKIEIKQDFIYYVLEGKMKLKSNEDEVILNSGDACFVPKGSAYTMSGTFKSIVVSQPAFGT